LGEFLFAEIRNFTVFYVTFQDHDEKVEVNQIPQDAFVKKTLEMLVGAHYDEGYWSWVHCLGF
jgi:hypothetical protein